MDESELFIRKELGKWFTLEEKSIGHPEQRLTNKVSQVTLENGVKWWRFSTSQYFQADTKNVKDCHSRDDVGLLPKSKSPWLSNYVSR